MNDVESNSSHIGNEEPGDIMYKICAKLAKDSKPEEAIKLFNKVLAINPSHSKALRGKAKAEAILQAIHSVIESENNKTIPEEKSSSNQNIFGRLISIIKR